MATSTLLPDDTAPGQHQPTARSAWRMPWMSALSALLVLAGVCLFLYPHIASWYSLREQLRVIDLQLNNWQDLGEHEERFRQHDLDQARAYNDALVSGAMLNANANVPARSAGADDADLDYLGLLNRSGSGLMARLKFDRLGIDLPVYHGTSDETLLKGVGHLQGTSLPVGGEGYRSVLTAHRGLASATMFDNLVDARIGDTFVVEVLQEVLAYRIVETQVVEPDEAEAIFSIPGRDLVTLVTCTPLGVNTHRVLVTGERVIPTPPEDLIAGGQPSGTLGFPWWGIVLGGSVVASGVFVWRSGVSRDA